MFQKIVRYRHHAPVLLAGLTLCCFALSATPAWASGPEPVKVAAAPPDTGSDRDLAELSIEDLMNINITSTARKPVRYAHATSAVFVISSEDIRRSGALALPEVLRMVPGLQVARISANQWAVSSRGFNGLFASKLLVLIDGRSVYTPAFSGVYWEVQDLLLEDIDRIEVIRGPGATMWGANAVNGVINIITKPAAGTQGGLVSAVAGTEERGALGIRHGGEDGNIAYRVYAKHLEREGSASPAGSFGDEGTMDRAGYRVDWTASASDSVTFQGDVYSGLSGQLLNLPLLDPPYAVFVEDQPRLSGGNALGRWQRKLSPSSGMTLQAYYDRNERREATYHEKQHTVDVAFDHRFRPGAGQELVWGLGYRSLRDEILGTFYSTADPVSRPATIISAFIQDEITAITDRLIFTLGTKIERNDYTGYELQPNARVLWTPDERSTVWSALSRAVRTPSRAERAAEGNIAVIPPIPPATTDPTLIRITGNHDFTSEELLAYEAGYRIKPLDTLFLDLAVFYHVYDNLRSAEPGTPFFETDPAPQHIVLPFVFANGLAGRVRGVELAADWRLLPWWSLNVAYAFLDMNLHRVGGSQDTFFLQAPGENPRHQASLRSAVKLSKTVEFDAWLRYVDDLPALDVDSYLTLDLRLGWKPRRNLELVLAGRNLLDDRHQEFLRESFPVPAEVKRSAYAKAVWKF